MLKFSKTNQISCFLKENKESDGIFWNISFVVMESQILIIYLANMR